MQLTAIGQIVANNLQTVSVHYQYAKIPLSVIMPNHLHTIVIIDGTKIPSIRRDIADHYDKNKTAPIASNGVSTNDKNTQLQIIANQSGIFIGIILAFLYRIFMHRKENEFGIVMLVHSLVNLIVFSLNCIFA